MDHNTETTTLTDEEAVERETQLLLLHGDAFVKLLQFERFRTFMGLNYEVKLVTESEEGIHYAVEELAPAVVAQRMQAELAKIQADQSPSLATVTAEDIKKFG